MAAALSRRDAELACDDMAIRRLGETDRLPYARTLITLTRNRRGGSDLLRCATTMTGGIKGIRERVAFIANKPKHLLPALIVTVLIALAAAGCTFTGVPDTPPSFAEWTNSITADEIGTAVASRGFGSNKIQADLTNDSDRSARRNLSRYLSRRLHAGRHNRR